MVPRKARVGLWNPDSHRVEQAVQHQDRRHYPKYRPEAHTRLGDDAWHDLAEEDDEAPELKETRVGRDDRDERARKEQTCGQHKELVSQPTPEEPHEVEMERHGGPKSAAVECLREPFEGGRGRPQECAD